MKKLRNIILQKIGNYVIHKMGKCDKGEVGIWYGRGLWFDEFCIENFELYLE